MLLFIHIFLFAINATGGWSPYNLSGILQTNLTAYTNNTNGTVNGVVNTDKQILPAFFLYLYITLLVVYFAIFAMGRSRKAFIGVAFLGLLTAIIMAGGGFIPLSTVGISWGIFMAVLAIVLFIGE